MLSNMFCISYVSNVWCKKTYHHLGPYDVVYVAMTIVWKRLSLGKHPNRAKGFAKEHAQALNVRIIVDKIYMSSANILTWTLKVVAYWTIILPIVQ